MKLRYEYADRDAGKVQPWFVGRAWRDYLLGVTICYVVPLNWFARWARDAWAFLRRGPEYRDALTRAAAAELDARSSRLALSELHGNMPKLRAEEYWRGYDHGRAAYGRVVANLQKL